MIFVLVGFYCFVILSYKTGGAVYLNINNIVIAASIYLPTKMLCQLI